MTERHRSKFTALGLELLSPLQSFIYTMVLNNFKLTT